MDPFEKAVSGEIPLEAAADFFMKLKYGSAGPDGQKIAAVKARLKEKDANMGNLGPTAMGTQVAPTMPQPLAPAGMGKHAGFISDTAKKMRAGLGKLVKGKPKAHVPAKPQNTGIVVRQKTDAAKAPFKDDPRLGPRREVPPKVHTKEPRMAHRKGSPDSPKEAPKKEMGLAAKAGIGAAAGLAAGAGAHLALGNKDKHAAAFRKAASEMFGEGMVSSGTVAPQVDMNQYMAMEEQGESAEQANQAEFLRAKLEEAKTELQMAQDQAQMAQQEAQNLQMQQSQHQQQLTAAQQQSQLATDAAMQNVQQAHELALKATTQALQAKDDAINTHQLAANMRMSYQDLRGSIMDAVAQDAAAPVGEAIKAQGALAQTPPMGMGGDPNAAPADPNAAAADPMAAGAEGGAPGATEDPSAAPAEAGGPPAPAAGAETPAAPEAPAAPAEDPAAPKTAGMLSQLGTAAMGHLKQKLPYAAAGAALGGGLTAIDSQLDNSGDHERVQELQGQPASFGQALRLAAAKARASFTDAVKAHPVAGTAFGAMAGAGAGMAMGPGIMDGFANLPKNINELRGKK